MNANEHECMGATCRAHVFFRDSRRFESIRGRDPLMLPPATHANATIFPAQST